MWLFSSLVSVSVFYLFRLEQQTGYGRIHSWSVLLPIFYYYFTYYFYRYYFHAAINCLTFFLSF